MKRFRDLCVKIEPGKQEEQQDEDPERCCGICACLKSTFDCCDCNISCKMDCCKQRQALNWHQQAQILLSKTVIHIIMMLRIKVKLENEQKALAQKEEEEKQAEAKRQGEY